MKKILLTLSAIAAVLSVTSCDWGNEPYTPQSYQMISDIYVLNNGNWGSNDASLTTFDYNSKKATANVFSTVNGKKIGDTAQDMIIYGSHMYIAVSNSGIIFVTDRTGKIEHEIKAGPTNNYSPRYFATYGGDVFVTYYEGYVGKIDTVNFSVSLCAVGNNPEGIAVDNSKIYVANSGGMNYPNYDNTVSVIEPKTFTVYKTLTVTVNPNRIVTDGAGNVYVLSFGDFDKVGATIQCINSSTDNVTTLSSLRSPLCMAMGPSYTLYVIDQINDGNTTAYKVVPLNTITNRVESEDFLARDVILEHPYSISVDPVNGMVFIGISDYVNTGDMRVFAPNGEEWTKFDTGGLNPVGAYFGTTVVVK